MKVKCIENTPSCIKNEIYTAYIDNTDDEIVELYIKIPNSYSTTIAQVMKRFYLKDNKNCWYLDYYFKIHFKIIE